MTLPPHRPIRRRVGLLNPAHALVLAAVLLLSLQATQWLGLAHGVHHGHAGPAVSHHAAGPSGDDVQALADVLGGAHDDGGPACRLVDVLSHADGPGADVACLVAAPPQAAAPAQQAFAAAPAGPAAAYEARGPPDAG